MAIVQAKAFLLVREEEEVRTCEGDNMVAPRSVQKGGGGAPSTRAEIALQPVVRTVGKQLHPCSPWGMQRSTHNLWGKCSHWNRWMPEKAVI